MPSAPPKHQRKAGARVHVVSSKQYDSRRGTANQRGYTYKWQKASAAFLAVPDNALCACGCNKLSTVVDHKTPHRGDMVLFWDRDNWQGMAKPCHDSKTAKEDGGFGR
ncbi:MAG: HNH endonuclease [Kordiimonadaceae bacterium]|nr:HNH endonuclease [Kordiimonadaceae bacterium]